VAFAVVTLALGIGASTLIFTLVQTALVRSLPFEHPRSLVWMYNARTERERAPFSIPDLDDYRRSNTTLANLAVFTNWAANLTGSGAPERLEGTRVSGNFFQVLGSRAWLGRTLEPRDEDGEARVVVLTYGLWQRRFGGDAAIVGRDVTLNGAAYTVVGTDDAPCRPQTQRSRRQLPPRRRSAEAGRQPRPRRRRPRRDCRAPPTQLSHRGLAEDRRQPVSAAHRNRPRLPADPLDIVRRSAAVPGDRLRQSRQPAAGAIGRTRT
jgi:MacB-like protein